MSTARSSTHDAARQGEETEVCFFKLGRFVSYDELKKEYALRGLELPTRTRSLP